MSTWPPKQFETDPQLDALLDEALSPQSVSAPDDLTQRIICRTVDRLTSGERDVVGRVGLGLWRTWAAAIAAVILLASGTVVWMSMAPDRTPADEMILAWEDNTEQELELLSLEIEQIQIARNWDSIDSDLDHDLTQWELGIAEDDLVMEF